MNEESKAKTLSIVKIILFVILALCVVSFMCDAIALNWIAPFDKSIDPSEYFIRFIKTISWISFSFGLVAVVSIVIDFFLNKKYKLLELVVLAGLAIELIVSLVFLERKYVPVYANSSYAVAELSSLIVALVVAVGCLAVGVIQVCLSKKFATRTETRNSRVKNWVFFGIFTFLFVGSCLCLIILPATSPRTSLEESYIDGYYAIENGSKYDVEVEYSYYNESSGVYVILSCEIKSGETVKVLSGNYSQFKIMDYKMYGGKDLTRLGICFAPLVLFFGYFMIEEIVALFVGNKKKELNAEEEKVSNVEESGEE